MKNKLTREDITNAISNEHYFQIEGTTLTICVLTLHNGFTVTGESSCIDPVNFNYKIGKEIAYDNAEAKVWMLEGYLLKNRIWYEENMQA
jgi:hypothetical protein